MAGPDARPPGPQNHYPDRRLHHHRPEARSGVWASQSDWQAHRQIISYLYCDRHMTLKDVKETMECRYLFFSTGPLAFPSGCMAVGPAETLEAESSRRERVYKYRFKQWGLAKYTKHAKPPNDSRIDGPVETGRPSPRCPRPASPVTSASPSPRAAIAKPLLPPGNLRILDACLSHLRAFLCASCGERRPATGFDPSHDMYLARASWTFSVNSAVLEIHRGRLGAGFRKLNTSFTQFRHALVADDTGFPLRLVSTLALLTDSGLPGLDTIFLQYAYHCLCIVLSPGHPFSTITRHFLAAAKKRPLEAAWFILAKYSEMLWQCSAPRPAPLVSTAESASIPEPTPGLLELSWDVARSVEREFVVPLSTQVGKVAWLPDAFSVSMAVAQIHLAQRLYGAARRTIDDVLARCHGHDEADDADPLDTALAYRKRWQISRAEGRPRAVVAADAHVFVEHCRATLGPAHYTTARALEECADYLGEEGYVAGAASEEGSSVPEEEEEDDDDGPGSPPEWGLVLRQGAEL